MRYYKFPKWFKPLYPGAIWDFYFKENGENAFEKTDKGVIYLTFDDGPNPDTTKWILDLLLQYNAKATFFCLGKNVRNHPELFQKIKDQGHQIGNHTFQHLNGFNTKTKIYIQDVFEAAKLIDSQLFRPPYGKLSPKQFNQLSENNFKTIFWSHITYDFDKVLATAKRQKKTLKRVKNGSIVVFHDSDKAFPQLENELPTLLEHWHQEGYRFEGLS